MKKTLLLLLTLFFFNLTRAQLMIDTLAMQNFDSVAYSPNWSFTGPVVYNSMGMSGPSMSPPNSPTGINNSRSWETTSQSGGLILTFDTITILPGYDSIRARLSLAAMNLIGAGGGPDNLDYVLVEASFNGGPYYNRIRVRGFGTAGCFWPYSASGKANVYYQPQTEAVFAPTVAGLQTTQGYSWCEIVFPGSVTQVSLRITGRSSSSSDTWLIDNVVLTGEKLVTGMNNISKTNSLKVYPNPANDMVYINRDSDMNSTLQVYNSLGEVVLTRELTKEKESFSVSTLANGIYFLKFDNITKKLIRQ